MKALIYTALAVLSLGSFAARADQPNSKDPAMSEKVHLYSQRGEECPLLRKGSTASLLDTPHKAVAEKQTKLKHAEGDTTQ